MFNGHGDGVSTLNIPREEEVWISQAGRTSECAERCGEEILFIETPLRKGLLKDVRIKY